MKKALCLSQAALHDEVCAVSWPMITFSLENKQILKECPLNLRERQPRFVDLIALSCQVGALKDLQSTEWFGKSKRKILASLLFLKLCFASKRVTALTRGQITSPDIGRRFLFNGKGYPMSASCRGIAQF